MRYHLLRSYSGNHSIPTQGHNKVTTETHILLLLSEYHGVTMITGLLQFKQALVLLE